MDDEQERWAGPEKCSGKLSALPSSTTSGSGSLQILLNATQATKIERERESGAE